MNLRTIAFFSTLAISIPLIGITREERLQGTLLSAMLGDCLGRVTEFKRDLETIFKHYPHGVNGPEDFMERDWVKVPAMFKQRNIMPYTDDSRMALLVLKSIQGPIEYTMPVSVYNSITTHYQPTLEERMTYLAHQFVTDQKDTRFGWAAPYRARGNACWAGVTKLSERFDALSSDPMWYSKIDIYNQVMSQFTKKRLWDVDALGAGGCGSVMRAYPCGMVFADEPEKAIEYAVTQSRLTHSHPIALAASAGIAAGVAAAIRGETVEEIVSAITDAAAQYDEKTAEKVRTAITLAHDNKPLLDSYGSALNALLQSKRFRDEHEAVFIRFPGWAADDALAGAVYCFCMSPESVIDAIHLGVHTSGDSDSIASLAGALVGAHCGFEQIREHILHIEDGDLAMTLVHAICEAQQK